jgi:pseudouridine-5'-phosphate glycosidase
VRLLEIFGEYIADSFIQETLGVPVVSYAATYDFPAFYSGRSGLEVRAYQIIDVLVH